VRPLQEAVEALRHSTGAPAVLAARRRGDRAERAAAGADPGSAFRTASVTKLFVAVAALRLVEQGSIALDTPLSSALPAEEASLLERAGFDLDRLTVDHLLQHTAGLPDHAEDPAYAQAVWADPLRAWTREEQVALACARGPLAAPGELVSYSDTGFVLLGVVLERATGAPLHAVVRRECQLDALGLADTWWELLEPARDVPRVEQHVGGRPTSSLSPTIDLFGGGGLVSTTADLAAFALALVSGRVLGPQALRLLLTVTPVLSTRPGAGRGVFAYGVGGATWWGHAGFWGVLAAADPASGRSVAVCMTEHEAFADLDMATLLEELLR
jgi:D-alanyl-D-alanine carboxypeptidase